VNISLLLAILIGLTICVTLLVIMIMNHRKNKLKRAELKRSLNRAATREARTNSTDGSGGSINGLVKPMFMSVEDEWKLTLRNELRKEFIFIALELVSLAFSWATCVQQLKNQLGNNTHTHTQQHKR